MQKARFPHYFTRVGSRGWCGFPSFSRRVFGFFRVCGSRFSYMCSMRRGKRRKRKADGIENGALVNAVLGSRGGVWLGFRRFVWRPFLLSRAVKNPDGNGVCVRFCALYTRVVLCFRVRGTSRGVNEAVGEGNTLRTRVGENFRERGRHKRNRGHPRDSPTNFVGTLCARDGTFNPLLEDFS